MKSSLRRYMFAWGHMGHTIVHAEDVRDAVVIFENGHKDVKSYEIHAIAKDSCPMCNGIARPGVTCPNCKGSWKTAELAD